MTTLRQDSGGVFCQDLEDPRQKFRYFYEEWKLCDCAGCSEELFGESMESWYSTVPERDRLYMPRLIAGRMKERPYCMKCLIYRKKREKQKAASRRTTVVTDKT